MSARPAKRTYKSRAEREKRPGSNNTTATLIGSLGSMMPKQSAKLPPVGPTPKIPPKAGADVQKSAERLRAAMGSSKAGKGIKGAALVRTRQRPAGPNAEIEGQAGTGSTERQYARGRRRWNVFYDSAGTRHVNSFLVKAKRRLH